MNWIAMRALVHMRKAVMTIDLSEEFIRKQDRLFDCMIEEARLVDGSFPVAYNVLKHHPTLLKPLSIRHSIAIYASVIGNICHNKFNGNPAGYREDKANGMFENQGG